MNDSKNANKYMIQKFPRKLFGRIVCRLQFLLDNSFSIRYIHIFYKNNYRNDDGSSA